jgi:hypothetical protein
VVPDAWLAQLFISELIGLIGNEVWSSASLLALLRRTENWRRRFFDHFDYIILWNIVIIIVEEIRSVAWSRWWMWRVDRKVSIDGQCRSALRSWSLSCWRKYDDWRWICWCSWLVLLLLSLIGFSKADSWR